MTANVILKRCGSSDLHLPPYARLILPVLDQLAQGHGFCLSAARTIARLAGCCVRTVQRAIQALEAAGLVETIRDYDLRTRRRIRLLWRPGAPFSERQIVAQVSANLSSQVEPPPDPPIEEPEGNKRKGGGGERIETSLESPCRETPPPPSLVIAPPIPKDLETTPRATPEQVADLVDQAAKVLPHQPAGWVKSLARRFGLRWVRAALIRAEAKRKAEGHVGTGYVVRALQGFAEQGGPPADIKDPEKTQAERAAAKAAKEAEYLAKLPELEARWAEARKYY